MEIEGRSGSEREGGEGEEGSYSWLYRSNSHGSRNQKRQIEDEFEIRSQNRNFDLDNSYKQRSQKDANRKDVLKEETFPEENLKELMNFDSSSNGSSNRSRILERNHEKYFEQYSNAKKIWNEFDEKGKFTPTVTPSAATPQNENLVHNHAAVADPRRKVSNAREDKNYCNCEKIKCNKLYCTCYRNGLGCSERCRCRDCLNTKHNLKQEKEDHLNLMTCRDEAQYEMGGNDEVYCSCRSNFCEKSYCACFKSGLGCGPKCKCFHCKNKYERRDIGRIPKQRNLSMPKFGMVC